MGLPLVQPYIESHNQTAHNIEGGVNFAVVGATALDTAFLEEMGVYNEITNDSLRIQLDWFQEMLSLLCNTSSGQLPIFLLIFSYLFCFYLRVLLVLHQKRHY